MRRAEEILLVLQSYTNDPGAQADCATEFFKSVDDGISENDIVILLCEKIMLGLKEGKWPWS